MRRISIRITTAFAMMGALAALGCGSKGAPPVAARLPKVDAAAALAAPDVPLPAAIVLLDASGGLRVGLPPSSWAIKLAKQPKRSLAVDLRYLRQIAGELRAGLPLAGILREGPRPAGLEDPPPPEPEDDPPPPEDDEADDDDRGGTGTAMVLEEGKMGKKDSDRAEGQYKMQRNVDHEQLARAQAIEQARTGGGVIPSLNRPAGGSFAAITGGDPGIPGELQLANRLAAVTGAIAEDGRLAPTRPYLLAAADPAAKARALIDVLAATGALVAVHHQGALRVLRLDFAFVRDASQPPSVDETWLEVRLGAGGLAFEAVPETPTPVAWPAGAALDAAALASTWKQVRARRGLDARTDVDVLVAADVDAQRLIDLLVALDAAGARSIGLGALPADDSPEAKQRGRRIPRLVFGPPQSVGDLDKAIIGRSIKGAMDKLEACHAQALAIDPDVDGTVMVQFFISPNGMVDSAAANGVTPALADCVRTVIKGIEFPKPKGGGGVQVNYPLRFTH